MSHHPLPLSLPLLQRCTVLTAGVALLSLCCLPAAAAPAAVGLHRPDASPEPGRDLSLAVAAALDQLCAAGELCRPGMARRTAGPIERAELSPGIAHYRFDIEVGPGATLVLHRVVREAAPYLPNPDDEAIFLVHGDGWGFVPNYLPATLAGSPVGPEGSLAAYLAAAGVDVWGVDLRWQQLPPDLADESVAAGWDLETDLDDLGVALLIARATRFATGEGFGRLPLLGFSRGGQLGYLHLAREATLPSFLRQVDGFVPVDIYLKTDDPVLAQRACDRHAETLAQIEAGQVLSSSSILAVIGELALAAPDDISPLFSFVTNRELALDVAGYPRVDGLTPDWHPAGGSFDEFGFVDGLLYTEEEHYYAFLTGIGDFEPLAVFLQAEEVTCPTIDSPLDDGLEQVTVPILYIGAGGAFGEFGVYTTTLLASTDVTALVVALRPPAERSQDLGHSDIFLAEDADSLFWQPIVDWLRSH